MCGYKSNHLATATYHSCRFHTILLQMTVWNMEYKDHAPRQENGKLPKSAHAASSSASRKERSLFAYEGHSACHLNQPSMGMVPLALSVEPFTYSRWSLSLPTTHLQIKIKEKISSCSCNVLIFSLIFVCIFIYLWLFCISICHLCILSCSCTRVP